MPDAVALLREQHLEVQQLFDQFERLQPLAQGSSSAYLEERRRLLEMIVGRLMKHSGIEEEHFYPALRRYVSDGEPLFETALGQHSHAEEVASLLEGMSPDNIDFDAHLRELISGVREHIRMEETEIFPRIEESLSDRQRLDLGAELEESMSKAPTRPHPHSPPPTSGVGKVLARGAAMVDRLRDAAMGRKA